LNLLITTGPTREPIDAVRLITNRSSGRMGMALAEAGREAGHAVTLLVTAGLPLPAALEGVSAHRFETVDQLRRLLVAHWPAADVLVMAAAVGDYRPARVAPGKIEREAGAPLALTLESTPDLIAACARDRRAGQRVVAFALESPDRLEARAREKLARKGADAIVANPVGTLDSQEIDPAWLLADGRVERPGTMSKRAFARWLMPRVEGLFLEGGARAGLHHE